MQGENGDQPTNGHKGFYQSNDDPDVNGHDFEAPDEDQFTQDTGMRIDWHASEYVHHDKGAMWLIILGVIAVVGAGVAIFFGQWLFAALIAVMAVAFGVYGFRQPKEMQYQLTDRKLLINDKTYSLAAFRAFVVIPDGTSYSALLIPVKRFMPALTIYFAEADGEKIIDILGAHLPMEDAQPDPIEAFMRKLRF